MYHKFREIQDNKTFQQNWTKKELLSLLEEL
jgi:hypothetical protein